MIKNSKKFKKKQQNTDVIINDFRRNISYLY